jgi:hypothetical protein
MKHLLLTILVLALLSCSKDEPEKVNTSPKAFEITAKSEGTDVILTWTEAVDEDGDAVTYAVVYGDTLAKGLSTRTYTINNLPYETEISGTVVASDAKGGKTESGFKVNTGEQIYALIPDREFERYLVQNLIDDEIDGKVLISKVREVTHIGFQGFNILNIEGLQYFENLEYIYFSSQSIAEITLPKLPRLIFLGVQNCKKLVKLDFQEVINLERLMVDGSPLKNVETQRNINLKEILILGSLSLEHIDLKTNTKLEKLQIPRSHVKGIDLSNNTNLVFLEIESIYLESLNLSNNPKIRSISLGSDELANLILPMDGKNLTDFVVNAKKLKKVDIDGLINLERLYLEGIELRTFDANKFPALNYLNLSNNKLETVKLGKLLKLEYLNIYDNLLQGIDLSGCPNMIRLDLSNNQLKNLNLCSQDFLNEVFIGGDGNTNLGEVYVKEAVRGSAKWNKWDHTVFRLCD